MYFLLLVVWKAVTPTAILESLLNVNWKVIYFPLFTPLFISFNFIITCAEFYLQKWDHGRHKFSISLLNSILPPENTKVRHWISKQKLNLWLVDEFSRVMVRPICWTFWFVSPPVGDNGLLRLGASGYVMKCVKSRCFESEIGARSWWWELQGHPIFCIVPPRNSDSSRLVIGCTLHFYRALL